MAKAFVSDAFSLFLARLFPALATFLVIILFSRWLPVTTYGAYSRFWIQLNLLGPLAGFGLQTLVLTYAPREIYSLWHLIRPVQKWLFGAWMLGIAVIFATLQSGGSFIWFITALCFLLVFACNTIIESVLLAARRFRFLLLANFMYAIAFTVLHFLLLPGKYEMYLLFLGITLALGIKTVVGWGSVSRVLFSHKEVGEKPGVELASVRTLWLHLGFYDVTQNVFAWIDKFVISLMLPVSVSAIYYNGTLNIPFLPLLLNAAASTILVQLASHQNGDRSSYTIYLLRQSARLLSAIVFPVVAFLFFYRYELVTGLLSDKYVQAVPIFALSVLVLPLRAYSFTTVIQKHHRGDLLNIGSVADLLLGCALMYPLYLWLGLPGVALAFVVSTYLQAAYYLVVTAQLLNVSVLQILPFGNWILKLAASVLIFFITRQFILLPLHGLQSLFLPSLVMVATIVSMLVWEWKLNPNNDPNEHK
jgi:O-antigen/teichoic acid export membrane protein